MTLAAGGNVTSTAIAVQTANVTGSIPSVQSGASSKHLQIASLLIAAVLALASVNL